MLYHSRMSLGVLELFWCFWSMFSILFLGLSLAKVGILFGSSRSLQQSPMSRMFYGLCVNKRPFCIFV